MKIWKQLILCTALLVFITACSSSTDEQGQAPDNGDKQDNTEQPEKDDDEQNDEQQNDGTTNEQEDPEGEDAADSDSDAEREAPSYYVSDSWYIKPLDEDTNAKVVLLTIDDAPDKHALEMAKTLKKLDAKAIFFVNGHFLTTPEKKEQLKEIHDMGFMIGNHTATHGFLPNLSDAEQKEEIISVNEQVEEIIGEKPLFFRAPNGANTDYSKELADQEDMILMNWSYGYDWEKDYQTKEAITDIMIHAPQLGDGANLLMHDRTWTSEALEDIVTGLRDQGYEILDPEKIETKLDE